MSMIILLWAFFISGLNETIYRQLCAIVQNDLKLCCKYMYYIWVTAISIYYSKHGTSENEWVIVQALYACQFTYKSCQLYQICPEMQVNEIQALYDKHHKVSSFPKSHQNT